MSVPEGIDLEAINPSESDDTIIIPDDILEEAGIEIPETEDISDNSASVDSDNEVETSKEEKTEKEKSLERGVNKERSLRKAAEKKNKELEERIKALEEKNKEPEKSTLDTLLESGVDESIAQSIANAIDNKKNNSKELEREIENLKFEKSLSSKSKEEGFDDIEEYAEEIKEFVDKGLTIEQAYHVVSYDKPTVNTKREIERTLEAKMQNNNAKKEILGNINSNVSAKIDNSSRLNLSKDEYIIAQMAGMTPEEYSAMKGINSNKDYTKFKSKKK